MPTYTRKAYQHTADILYNVLMDCKAAEFDKETSAAIIARAAEKFAALYALDNANFNETRFLDAVKRGR